MPLVDSILLILTQLLGLYIIIALAFLVYPDEAAKKDPGLGGLAVRSIKSMVGY